MLVESGLFEGTNYLLVEGWSYQPWSGQPHPFPSSWMLHLGESMIERMTSNSDPLLLVLVAQK